MRPIDRYDVTEAFESLDTDCDGLITINGEDGGGLLDLFLGLGYQPISISAAELTRAAGGVTQLTLPQVIEVLSKVRACVCARQRSAMLCCERLTCHRFEISLLYQFFCALMVYYFACSTNDFQLAPTAPTT